MGLFKPAMDKESVFRRALKAAIENADTAELERALAGMGDLSKLTLVDALNLAISKDMIKATTLLIQHGGEPHRIKSSTLRDVISNRREEMFRLLHPHVNFYGCAEIYRSSSGTEWVAEWYIDRLNTMEEALRKEKAAAAAQKHVEEKQALLRQIAEQKEEITALRQTLIRAGVSLPSEPPKPPPKSGGLSL